MRCACLRRGRDSYGVFKTGAHDARPQHWRCRCGPAWRGGCVQTGLFGEIKKEA